MDIMSTDLHHLFRDASFNISKGQMLATHLKLT